MHSHVCECVCVCVQFLFFIYAYNLNVSGMQKVYISQIIQTGRNLWRFVSHLRQGLLEQAFQDCVPSCFEYLHSWRINNLSGQPTPVFNYPYNKEVFFGDNFMCFTHCPLPLILSVGTVEKSLAQSSLQRQYSTTYQQAPSELMGAICQTVSL